MKPWQIAVIAIAILLMGAGAIHWMPPALESMAANSSEWLGVALYLFIVGPGLITAGLVYGVWKLGQRRNPDHPS